MLAGLLAVDPHRLYLYWDVSGLDGLTLTLTGGGPAWTQPRTIEPAGGLYMTGLDPDRPYQAEFVHGGEVVLRSNQITLPPDREYLEPQGPEEYPEPYVPAELPEIREEVPSSASLHP